MPKVLGIRLDCGEHEICDMRNVWEASSMGSMGEGSGKGVHGGSFPEGSNGKHLPSVDVEHKGT